MIRACPSPFCQWCRQFLVLPTLAFQHSIGRRISKQRDHSLQCSSKEEVAAKPDGEQRGDDSNDKSGQECHCFRLGKPGVGAGFWRALGIFGAGFTAITTGLPSGPGIVTTELPSPCCTVLHGGAAGAEGGGNIGCAPMGLPGIGGALGASAAAAGGALGGIGSAGPGPPGGMFSGGRGSGALMAAAALPYGI